MISLTINNVPVLFAQGFSREDSEIILDFVREANHLSTTYRNTVLFIDTPATTHLVDTVHHLKTEGVRVIFRDHHGVAGEPENVRDEQKQKACQKLEQLLGDDCVITFRDLHPACSTLVEVGEFADALAIIADPDADGLTAAMKAAGISYPELDEDAALLDSEPAVQMKGSRISSYLAMGLATLPSYDPERPREREQIQQKLFSDWVEAVQGSEAAMERLKELETRYQEARAVALRLSDSAQKVTEYTVLVDATGNEVFDVGTLNGVLEGQADTRITVLKKDKGPIAALHGIQYSLSVARPFHPQIDLRKLLPSHANSDPANGIISNVSFLLHVSESVWHEFVLPGLKSGVYRT